MGGLMKHWLMTERERFLLRELDTIHLSEEMNYEDQERAEEIEAELDSLALALDEKEER
jgi:hypothetical protein